MKPLSPDPFLFRIEESKCIKPHCFTSSLMRLRKTEYSWWFSVIIRSFNGVPEGSSYIMFYLYFSYPNPIKFLFKPVFFLAPFLWLLCFPALPLCDVQITFYQRWGNQRQPESWIKIVAQVRNMGEWRGPKAEVEILQYSCIFIMADWVLHVW